MATPPVLRDFRKQAGTRPGIDPDIIETLVEFKDSYFSDPDPAHWSVGVLEELLLDVLPRKVTAPDEWFSAVAPTTRAYLRFLGEGGRLAPGSDPATDLLDSVDRIGDQALAAARDPRNFGMAKAILSRFDLDLSMPDAAHTLIEAFNALPDAERAAVLDPALRGQALDDALSRVELEGSAVGDPGRPSLPLVWLPPVDELAAAVGTAPLVRDLLRLTAWVGDRYGVTRKGVLPLADARRACAALGLAVPPGKVRSAEGIPALQRLWSLAVDSELLEVAGRVVVRGDAADLLTDADSAPEDVVSWWVHLLDTCLIEGLDLVDEFDGDDEDDEFDGDDEDDDGLEPDVLDAVDGTLPPLLVELYSAGWLPLDALDRAVGEMVGEVLARPWVAEGLSDEQIHEQTQGRWRAHVTQLVDVGAAVVEDGGLDLTPLGRIGVRAIALDDGGEAPLVDDPAALDAAALLQALPPLGESVGRSLLMAWSGTRSPEQAVDEILDTARTGMAGTRATAATVLKDHFGAYLQEAGRPRLEALREDPILGTYARVLLTEPGQAVQLPPRLQQWAALEAVAVALESGAFDETDPSYDADGILPLWQIVEEDAELDSAWTSDHPQLGDVLDAIASHHPKGRIRKAAKKALFKARQRNP